MLRILLTALRLYSYALLIYLFLKMLMPTHQATRFLSGICEPVLRPVAKFLYKNFPDLYKLPFDFSPLAVFLLINLTQWLLRIIF